MPIPKAKKIKETLEELKNYFDRLKSINAKREQAEDILEKIEEIRKLLDKKDPPVREAFGLLRRLIECVKDVAPEIPVFTQFLELYIEALKTTESFLDNVLKNFGVAAEARKRYCQIREAVEDQLEDSDLDDDDFDDEAHRRTLSALGFPFNKDGDKLREFWDKKKEAEEIKDEIAEAEDIKEELEDDDEDDDDDDDNSEEVSTPVIVTPQEPLVATPLTPSPKELCCAKHGTTRPVLDERKLSVGRNRIGGSLGASHPCGIASVKLEVFGFTLGSRGFGGNDIRLVEAVELAPTGAPKSMRRDLRFARPPWSRGIYLVVTVRSTCNSVYKKGFASGT